MRLEPLMTMRYKWLNRVIAVAEGRLVSGNVEYRVFEVVHD